MPKLERQELKLVGLCGWTPIFFENPLSLTYFWAYKKMKTNIDL
jgi:hypothetical protein